MIISERTKAEMFKFPNLETFLCPEETITLEESIMNYRQALLDTNNWYNIGYANKLLEYLQLTPDELDFSEYIAFLRNLKYQNMYDFNIKFFHRKKSYIKLNKKIRLFIMNSILSESNEDKKQFSLDRICDEHGIRLILDFPFKDNEYTVNASYSLLTSSIEFFTRQKGYCLKLAEPLIETGYNNQIFIPKKSGIPEDIQINVKDYYLYPKANGYQSLHTVLQSPTGVAIELQVRTSNTDLRIRRQPESCQDAHDKERYPYEINVDYSKVNISGFNYDKSKVIIKDTEGVIEDKPGLLQSSILETII